MLRTYEKVERENCAVACLHPHSYNNLKRKMKLGSGGLYSKLEASLCYMRTVSKKTKMGGGGARL